MKVTGVRTATGTPVTLLFVDAGVHVLDGALYSGRVFRAAGGAVFAAIGLAAAGLGVGHAVDSRLGSGLSVAALVLAAAAGLVAATAWVVAARAVWILGNGAAAPTVAVAAVTWAQSTQQHGRVCVILGMADGGSREFSAAGVTGTELARQFGRLLRVADSSDTESAPSDADAGTAPDGSQPR